MACKTPPKKVLKFVHFRNHGNVFVGERKRKRGGPLEKNT